MSIIKIIYHIFLEYFLIIKNRVDCRKIPEKWSHGKRGKLLFLQGFNGNVHSFFTLAQLANSWGYQVHFCQKLGNNTMPVAQAVEIVKKYILTNSLKKIVIIGHSKGGLIARMLLSDQKTKERIASVITIASPHGGSLMGWLLPSAFELTPMSTMIKQLAQKNEHRDLIHNLYPRIDNHVIPNRNLVLEGANNHQIDVIGHTMILESEQTKITIKQILETLARD